MLSWESRNHGLSFPCCSWAFPGSTLFTSKRCANDRFESKKRGKGGAGKTSAHLRAPNAFTLSPGLVPGLCHRRDLWVLSVQLPFWAEQMLGFLTLSSQSPHRPLLPANEFASWFQGKEDVQSVSPPEVCSRRVSIGVGRRGQPQWVWRQWERSGGGRFPPAARGPVRG